MGGLVGYAGCTCCTCQRNIVDKPLAGGANSASGLSLRLALNPGHCPQKGMCGLFSLERMRLLASLASELPVCTAPRPVQTRCRSDGLAARIAFEIESTCIVSVSAQSSVPYECRCLGRIQAAFGNRGLLTSATSRTFRVPASQLPFAGRSACSGCPIEKGPMRPAVLPAEYPVLR